MTGGRAGGFGTCVCVLVCLLAMLLFTHHHHYGNPSHIFELHARGKAQVFSPAPGKGWGLQAPAITLAHLSKVHPSPPPNLCPPPRLSLPQFPFFRLRPCLLGLDRCCGVVWGWHPRSLLTERRMVVHPGAGSFPTPPPPTRPPHGPDAASRPLASKTQK